MLDAFNNLMSPQEGRVLVHVNISGKTFSLRQFQKDASALKKRVEESQVDSWLLYSESPYYFLLGFMVLLGLGKKVVICANARPKWIELFSNEFGAVLSDEEIIAPNKKSFNFLGLENDADLWRPHLNGNEEVVFFTSGSTGEPKAVKKLLIALINEINTLESTFKLRGASVVFVGSVSHLHIYGLLFKLLWPLLTKNTWLETQVEYHEQINKIANVFESVVFVSSPAFLSRLDAGLSKLKLLEVFSSGGPLPYTASIDSKNMFGKSPTEIYGSTETGGVAYRTQQNENSSWIPFEGIVLSEIEAGTYLSSPHVPEQESVLLDDRLLFSNNGSFVLQGRKDRIVKLEEKRISLTEIEDYLNKLEPITKAVVLVLKGERDVLGCVLVLSDIGEKVVEKNSKRLLIKELKASMKERFEAVVIPKKWRIISEIPVDSQSKVSTNQLIERFE